MKKIVSFMLVGAMIMSLAACSANTGTQSAAPSQEKAESGSAGEAGSAASDEAASSQDDEVTLTAFVCAWDPTTGPGQAMTLFGEKCEEYSGGSLKVECYYSNDLGNVSSAVESVAQGTIDICTPGTSYLAGYVPEIQVFELPFMFSDVEDAYAALDGAPGQAVSEKLDDVNCGFKLLTFWESGMRYLTNKNKPVHSVADMKGIKIRTVVSETQKLMWESYGAIPMALDMSEVFAALQTGTVDAQENTLGIIDTYKFSEVQKYMTMTGHSYTPMPFLINTNTWNKLSPAQQDALLQASHDARDLNRKIHRDNADQIIEKLESEGVEIDFDPDKQSFIDASQPVYDYFINQCGQEFFDMVRDFIASL